MKAEQFTNLTVSSARVLHLNVLMCERVMQSALLKTDADRDTSSSWRLAVRLSVGCNCE